MYVGNIPKYEFGGERKMGWVSLGRKTERLKAKISCTAMLLKLRKNRVLKDVVG